ncbi:MAG: hypothetical protein AB1640_19375 [bacterium]
MKRSSETEGRYPDDFREKVTAWAIVTGIAVSFTLFGLFVFFTVGDKGPPPWSYGSIADVPGDSPYSSVESTWIPGQTLPLPPEQHVGPEHAARDKESP